MVLLAVIKRKVKESLEEEDIIRCQSNIICLTNSRYHKISALRHPKFAILSICDLIIIKNFVEFTGVFPALLSTPEIANGAHQLFVPFTKCLSVFQPFIYQDKALVSDSTMIERCNENFSNNKIKS
jgi:hypothetical protein